MTPHPQISPPSPPLHIVQAVRAPCSQRSPTVALPHYCPHQPPCTSMHTLPPPPPPLRSPHVPSFKLKLILSQLLTKPTAHRSFGSNSPTFVGYVYCFVFQFGIFSVCAPPQLSGRILFVPPHARAIFLHSNLLCNGTCFVTGGRITYWGAQTEKIPSLLEYEL